MIAELEESIAQADRGQGVPMATVLAELDEIARRTKSK
jgi:hypothetical protein